MEEVKISAAKTRVTLKSVCMAQDLKTQGATFHTMQPDQCSDVELKFHSCCEGGRGKWQLSGHHTDDPIFNRLVNLYVLSLTLKTQGDCTPRLFLDVFKNL